MALLWFLEFPPSQFLPSLSSRQPHLSHSCFSLSLSPASLIRIRISSVHIPPLRSLPKTFFPSFSSLFPSQYPHLGIRFEIDSHYSFHSIIFSFVFTFITLPFISLASHDMYIFISSFTFSSKPILCNSSPVIVLFPATCLPSLSLTFLGRFTSPPPFHNGTRCNGRYTEEEEKERPRCYPVKENAGTFSS